MSTEQPQNPQHQTPQNQYAQGQFPPYPQYQQQPSTSGKAVASMVTGIVSIVVPFVGIVTGPLAIILGAKARGEIQRTRQQGNGLAIAGLVTGIIGCVGYAIFLLIIIIGALSSTTTGT
ncbi:DUF4190 domain-containing protein [Streptomyces piniterrae]|uniref:DUF4190 domain-containing protein n=1 Tax=Streptomyces piniterrae TaxID=2571125 RepID=A0A4U0NYW5_9ACTN|nr:DUF4190 domain-containing protein [Streptomyces piniterrae]TJZ55554.1 DUF4190 domain-containing protein [Streptomyces piniterrae]